MDLVPGIGSQCRFDDGLEVHEVRSDPVVLSSSKLRDVAAVEEGCSVNVESVSSQITLEGKNRVVFV